MICIHPFLSAISQALFGFVVLFLNLVSFESFAQIFQLKYTAASYSGNLINGPCVDEVAARFVGTETGNGPTIGVTASLSDQQFKNIAGTPSLNGIFFGGTSNDDSKTVQPTQIWTAIGAVSEPTSAMFTANPTAIAGQGIDISTNHGFNIFTSVEPLYSLNKDRGGRYYYGTLTLSFSHAISNPILHVAGLGGFTFDGHQILGYSTELELQDMRGLSLTVLSGNEALKVEGNKIANGKDQLDAFSRQSAATGSIRVNGSNIKQVVLKVFLRGDNRGAAWSTPNFFAGDQWVISVSMNSAVLSGNVYNDANGLLGSPVNTVDGVGVNGLDVDSEMPGEQSLFANILNAEKRIVKTASVSKDGGYLFQDVLPAVYDVVLSSGKESASASLPEGWVNTGDNLGAQGKAGNDGKADGYFTNVSIADGANVFGELNFGINKRPTVQNTTQIIAKPSVGEQLVIDGSLLSSLTASDYEDGQIGEGGTLIIKTLSDHCKLVYGGAPVAVNTPISNLKNNKLLLTIANLDSNKINFEYTFMDKAGSVGTTGTYQVAWTEKGSVVDVAEFSAKKRNGSALLTWTNADMNFDGAFDLEYSTDGSNWANIGQHISSVDGKGTHYSFVHDALVVGLNMYRVKTTSVQGAFFYSVTRKITVEAAGETFVYPNPAVDVISVKVDGKDDLSGLNALNIYDASGKLVMSPSLKSDKVDVNALKNGFYVVQFLRKSGEVSTSKMSVMR